MSDVSLFGTRHIIYIVLSVALIVLLYLLSRKITLKLASKMLLVIGIVSEIIKVFYYIVANEETHGGVLPKTDLPFHLCSIQIILILIVNVSKSEKLNRMIFSFMMPSCLFGGIAAILIATDSARSSAIIAVQYFLYHIAITVFALKLLTEKGMKWRVKDMLDCFKILLAMMFFAIYINSIVFDIETATKVNFMYVVSPPQNGLPFLTEKYGWLVYIVHYACLIVFCVSLCYIKAIIDTVKDKKASKAEEKTESRV